jgi:hypothetical protein
MSPNRADWMEGQATAFDDGYEKVCRDSAVMIHDCTCMMGG